MSLSLDSENISDAGIIILTKEFPNQKDCTYAVAPTLISVIRSFILIVLEKKLDILIYDSKDVYFNVRYAYVFILLKINILLA